LDQASSGFVNFTGEGLHESLCESKRANIHKSLPPAWAPTKNAVGNETAFSVHKGKKETQRLSGRLPRSWSFAKNMAFPRTMFIGA
jgi:hypothetical protein